MAEVEPDDPLCPVSVGELFYTVIVKTFDLHEA